jgi:hypothetical protein
MQPVYFRHGYSEVDKITISLPAGYRVEALPPEANLKTAFATYQAKRTGEAGVVRLERHAVISQYSFPRESYGSLRQYFDQLRQSDAENVVLYGMQRRLINGLPLALAAAFVFAGPPASAGT